jgi:hypothetical protein
VYGMRLRGVHVTVSGRPTRLMALHSRRLEGIKVQGESLQLGGDARQANSPGSGASPLSCAEVSFNFFRSGIQQACPEGPLIGCLPCGDSLKPWVPLSTQDLTMSVSEGGCDRSIPKPYAACCSC